MKTSCYVIKTRFYSEDEIVGVTATFEEAKELRLLIAKKEIFDDYILSRRFANATEEDYSEYAKEFYSIHEENFYSKPFNIEELLIYEK